jgi:hypothetical protein
MSSGLLSGETGEIPVGGGAPRDEEPWTAPHEFYAIPRVRARDFRVSKDRHNGPPRYDRCRRPASASRLTESDGCCGT